MNQQPDLGFFLIHVSAFLSDDVYRNACWSHIRCPFSFMLTVFGLAFYTSRFDSHEQLEPTTR